MNNKEFGKKLEERTKVYAFNILKLSSLLPNTPEARVIRNQVTKSGTSIGANYREANRARSESDFSNKIKICESETNETIYWLEIIQDLKWCNNDQISTMIMETEELLSIFESIGKTLRSKKQL